MRGAVDLTTYTTAPGNVGILILKKEKVQPTRSVKPRSMKPRNGKSGKVEEVRL